MRRGNGTGSVYKLHGNRRKPWIAIKTNKVEGQEKPVKTIVGYATTSTEAKALLDAYNVGAYEPVKNITLRKVYDEWRTQKERNTTDQTMKMYKYAWEKLSSLGSMKFAEIRTAHLQHVVNKMDDEGMSHSTISLVKTLMSQLYRHANKNDIVTKDYSKYIDMPKKNKSQKTTFTDLEIKRLHELAVKDPYINPILIMIYTGMRISELMDLTRFNIDLENMVITGGIKSDAGRDRVIPIHPKIQGYIKYWYDQDNEALIVTKTSRKMNADNYRANFFNPLMEQYGFRSDLTPHSCRHTFASKLAVAGVDTLHIQKLIGHADYALTANTYSHLEVDELKKAIGKMI
ncbi:tyrosine-type recombinase/integrase [Gudongella sp. SC589]|uniref:tyrosine-type recombinase/integrase n=1 Tax=Gudongella sp. SC589 TaxID=3385990 RepID=UPI0039047561